MIELVQRHIIPAAFDLLPDVMRSDRAVALLLAIGQQESRFVHRKQINGPARGFFMFEVAGVRGVLEHERSREPIRQALRILRYAETQTPSVIQAVLEHNDVLAVCFARCLLWTSPRALPGPEAAAAGWLTYFENWRPGKPRRETWDAAYTEAWTRTVEVGNG